MTGSYGQQNTARLALGGRLGGGVTGECRAAIFLPERVAPLSAAAASPWRGGVLVRARPHCAFRNLSPLCDFGPTLAHLPRDPPPAMRPSDLCPQSRRRAVPGQVR